MRKKTALILYYLVLQCTAAKTALHGYYCQRDFAKFRDGLWRHTNILTSL